jgi:WD40 repeat protein
MVGTPAYMSPEQARGAQVDALSDLFSLGCVMYRMATARMPFHGKDIAAMLLSVANETPLSPKVLNRDLPNDLAAVIDRLLAKKPEDRFASAKAVVEAIQQIEDRRRPRHVGRWLTLLAAAVALSIVTTLAVLGYLHRPGPPVQVTLEYDEPDSVLLLQGENGSEKAIDTRTAAQEMLPPGNYTVRPKAPSENRRLWPGSFVVRPNEPMVVPFRLIGLIRTLDGHSHGITSVTFVLRTKSAVALSASLDHDLRMWNVNTDEAGIRFVGHQSPARCLAVSLDGKRAITGSGQPNKRTPDTCVRVWDLDARSCIATLSAHESSVTAVAFHANGKLFLSGDKSGIVIFWDARSLKPIQAIEAHDRSDVLGLIFLPGGKQALSCGGDHKLLLWDVDKRAVSKTFEGHLEAVTGVSASPDGKYAATSSLDGTVRVWNLATADSRVIKGHEKEVHCVAYSPDGKRLLSGGRDKTVRLWDAHSGESIHVFLGHHKAVHSVAFSGDGRRALSGGSDATLCLWELPK